MTKKKKKKSEEAQVIKSQLRKAKHKWSNHKDESDLLFKTRHFVFYDKQVLTVNVTHLTGAYCERK